jgi:hypothetical protein
MARPLLFLSDYGLKDPFVGICHAVIARLAPEAHVIDLTHSIARQDVTGGALALADAAAYGPEDAVCLAIVDPGVGTERRRLVVAAGDALLVGPDNGLLSLAWERLGGATGAWEVTSRDVMLPAVSETFHGRDVFAPVAARLATGLSPEEVGPALDPKALVRIEVPPPQIEDGAMRTEVIGVDRFGNIQLSAGADDLAAAGLDAAQALELRWGVNHVAIRRARTYGDVGPGEFALLIDSSGRLAVATNLGSAAEDLAIGRGDPVTLGPPREGS